MFSKKPYILVAISGIVGPIVLVASFMLNPAPPASDTTAQLRDFTLQHHNQIAFGGWLQGIGSLLIVLFVISLIHFAGAAQRISGWITFLASSAILMVSLTEVAFYLAAVQAVEAGDTASALASNTLIKAVQHVFLIAPAILLPLGYILLTSPVLPRVFAYLALALGGALQVFGLLGVFNFLQPVIDILLIVQSLWFVAAAVALLFKKKEYAVSFWR